MHEERIAATAWRLRASLLWLVFMGVVGSATVLAYERHWDGYWQLVPWAVLALVLLSLLALVIFPCPTSRKLVRLVAVATIIASCLGLWQHFDQNYEAASLDVAHGNSWEDMSHVGRIWEVATGSVGHVPIYAAAILIPIGMALAMSTIGIGLNDRNSEYVDPRQRR